MGKFSVTEHSFMEQLERKERGEEQLIVLKEPVLFNTIQQLSEVDHETELNLSQWEMLVYRSKQAFMNGRLNDYKEDDIKTILSVIGYLSLKNTKRSTAKELVDIWFDRTDTEELYEENIEDNIEEKKTELVAPFTWCRLKHFLNRPPPEWLIDDTLAKNSLTVLYGPPASGKSFVAIDWACCIQTGTQWSLATTGGTSETSKGGVLYMLLEGSGGAPARFHAWMRRNPSSELNNLIIIESHTWSIDDKFKRGGYDLVDFINSLNESPALIVIDTLSHALIGGNDNSAQDMHLFLESLKSIIISCNCANLVIHHANKGGGLRGTTALLAAADTVIKAQETELGNGRYTLDWEKMKDAKIPNKKEFWLRETFSETGRPPSAVPCKHLKSTEQEKILRSMRWGVVYDTSELSRKLKKTSQSMSKLLNKLTDSGYIEKVGHGKWSLT